MRELLDNKDRAEKVHRWYMKDFLNSMVTIVREVPGLKLTETEALARVYLIFGAFNYFLISQPTLKQMYGKRTFSALKDVMPTEIQRLVRRSFEG
jgi:hypothetical protein